MEESKNIEITTDMSEIQKELSDKIIKASEYSTSKQIFGEKILYSAGFLFDEKRENVVLIRKTKPEIFKGLLNGVGGKVELGESFYDAMVREFREETGVEFKDWRQFASIDTNRYTCRFFMGVGDITQVKTTTEEEVMIVPVNNIGKVIFNLNWLIPMALDSEVLVALVSQ